MKKPHNLLTENEQKRLYLVHHMHHLRVRKDAAHELHHCFLFSKKKMRGEKYKIKHLIFKGRLFHVLGRAYNGALYDHAGNEFIIKSFESSGKKYSVLK